MSREASKSLELPSPCSEEEEEMRFSSGEGHYENRLPMW